MNRLKKGPEIKLPELRVPDFVLDLYYDLRDRHLLPVAIVLVLSIIVVPIALSQSSNSEGLNAGAVAEEAGIAISSSANDGSGELVAKFAPGLRDYKRRLSHLRAKDPFKQQYTAPPASSAPTVANEALPTSTGTSAELVPPAETESAPATAPPSSETTPPSESGPTPTPGPGNVTYYSYALDVRVTMGATQESEPSSEEKEATARHSLPELTMLPSRKTPAVIYMGSSKDGKKALMLVSSDVKAIFGDAKCVLGSQTCELLALEPGLPETFVYGGAGKTFKIEVLKIDLVETDKLNRAPLGKKKSQKQRAGRITANSQAQPR